jgi:hypothetical protein
MFKKFVFTIALLAVWGSSVAIAQKKDGGAIKLDTTKKIEIPVLKFGELEIPILPDSIPAELDSLSREFFEFLLRKDKKLCRCMLEMSPRKRATIFIIIMMDMMKEDSLEELLKLDF